MSMPMPYDNNQHDDYANHMHSNFEEQPFDLKMVTNEIPYYDLPAGLMCLLVKVSFISIVHFPLSRTFVDLG